MIKFSIHKQKFQLIALGLLFTIGVFLLILSYFTDSFSSSALSSRSIGKLEKRIHEKQEKLEKIAYQWLDDAQSSNSQSFIPSETFTTLENTDDLLLYGFKSDSILYWSSKVAISQKQLLAIDTVSRFTRMGNNALKTSDEEGSYVARSFTRGGYKAVGLIWIRSDYSYENEFLKSRFNPSLKFPASTYVASLSEMGQVVFSKEGRPLFTVSLDVSDTEKENKYPRMLRWLSMYFILIAFTLITLATKSSKHPFLLIAVYAVVLCVARIFLFYYPSFLGGGGKLFSPVLYAVSDTLPSLGDLLLNVMFFMLLVVVIYRKRLNALGYISKCSRAVKVSSASILIIVISAVAIAIHYIIISLLHNSSLPLEPYRLSDISYYTVVVYGILAMAVSALFLLQLYFITLYSGLKKVRWLVASSLSVLLLILAFGGITSGTIYFLVFYAASIILNYLHYKEILKKANYLLLVVLLTSLYILAIVAREAGLRERQEREIVALSLSTQRDPTAEALFKELGAKLEADEVLADLVQDPIINRDAIYERLVSTYLGGYFNRYSLTQVNICPDDGVIRVDGESGIKSCWEFYDDIINTAGGNHIGLFHFLNHNNGRINYLGRIAYPSYSGEGQIALFIDLRSKSENQQIGYPELLLEKNDSKNIATAKDYSYAIYHDKKRVSIYGSYRYGFELKESDTNIDIGNYYLFNSNGYSHLLMKFDEHNVIIVSLKLLKYSDYILSFSYIFLFFYLSIGTYVWIGGFFTIRKSKSTTFKQRITRTILVLLTVFFVATGVSMLWYNISQYKKSTIAGIEERLNMVLFEFDQEFSTSSKAELESQKDYLSYFLVDLSNIYRTDINIYTADGRLLASSRNEVFDKGLQGEQINPKAFRTLKYENLSRFIDEEYIGLMSYYSAYTPYYSSNDEELAIINLPYFAKQAEMRQEISSLTLTVLNIFILLVLVGFLIAVTLANRIARPLEAVRISMQKLDLSDSSKPISYDGNDELGDLVREYNRITVELADNAKRLAQSERESAWREMARQIAHEIKNPLTPMKLSIQHVMRMKAGNVSGWQDKIEDLAKSLIEQIDTLAATASEFSSFAMLSNAEKGKVNIPVLLREQLTLFAGYENVRINLNISDDSVYVVAHREQLQRVFTNLIKNAIQAIGSSEGVIDITVTQSNKHCSIRVEDNGPGISPEKQRFLFQPNFTTKSGGTGLGLAISKNIIENIGGSICFKSAVKGGAIFTVTIPLIS